MEKNEKSNVHRLKQAYHFVNSIMKQVYEWVNKVADTKATVIINGETGTGKGEIAKEIHLKSPRRNKPFISINCGAIPENLLESELFGHKKGSFTGALVDKIGKFAAANGGTIFLDEIGDMSPDLQVKLLKVLDDGEFTPVGGTNTDKTDVRVIAATHRNLEDEVKNGKFREDLYYRLFVVPITLPPLRKQKFDIPGLVSFFIEHFNRKNNCDIDCFSDEALCIMQDYSWPGNIRELKNVIERCVIYKGKGIITEEDLPKKLKLVNPFLVNNIPLIGDEGIDLFEVVREFERNLIIKALEEAEWSVKKAAELLGIKRTTLTEKKKRYKIKPSEDAAQTHAEVINMQKEEVQEREIQEAQKKKLLEEIVIDKCNGRVGYVFEKYGAQEAKRLFNVSTPEDLSVLINKNRLLLDSIKARREFIKKISSEEWDEAVEQTGGDIEEIAKRFHVSVEDIERSRPL